LDQGIEKLAAHDLDLVRVFLEGISDIPALTLFGPNTIRNRLGVFSVRVEGLDPHELSMILESQYGILTRPGLHCAPLIHLALGTIPAGTTRFSFSPFLTKQDVNYATDALAHIATEISPAHAGS